MSTSIVPTLVCTLCLLGSPAVAQQAQPPADLHQAQASWLSRQLHVSVEAAQILVSPDSTTLEGCTITRLRPTSTGATALSLRCPASRLPHLVLLNLSSGDPHPPAVGECMVHLPSTFPKTSFTLAAANIVRAGAALTADWRTAFIHAQLPVVALDSGPAGAEIRVRIPQTNRIVRARILSPSAVAIVVTGV